MPLLRSSHAVPAGASGGSERGRAVRAAHRGERTDRDGCARDRYRVPGVVVTAYRHARILPRRGLRGDDSQRPLATPRLLVEDAVEPEQPVAHVDARAAGIARADLRRAIVQLVEPAVGALVGVLARRAARTAARRPRRRCASSSRSRGSGTSSGAPRRTAASAASGVEAPTLHLRPPTWTRVARAVTTAADEVDFPASSTRTRAALRPRVAAAAGARIAAADVEHDAVGAAHEALVAIAGAIERLHVQHVAAGREPAGQQVGPVPVRADRGRTPSGRTPSPRNARACRSTSDTARRARGGAARASRA